MLNIKPYEQKSCTEIHVLKLIYRNCNLNFHFGAIKMSA